MEALTYEMIIRRAFNCERGGAEGMADADVYRRIQKSALYRESDGYNPKERGAIITVSENLGRAIRQILKDHQYDKKHTVEVEKLHQLYKSYNSFDSEKKELDKFIQDTITLVNKIKEIN